ncbi:S-adenosyl-L-methionine-dependent methyltransferase [Dichomitus squalens]|uniref:S-adenosyl-L-methionine-dependent methyltransferase n=1 Tax=Dichomitus squalens TaxID=114155 RepID=A0A4Q9QDA0_9APHY|nr:S-adenosyl-L-methionine-dependent methyltransferase [Dichomitus squalens LYAD-421 SS1]EJF65922.1 S-adenosyl-L-methionine-dependent methyltransferase [Dichomitus squalens LYAD-421 SS1]TBU35910.1 S-adenosyl-L-methionine-dependent methyltransferase [Dichomitus squalens]TBU50849.1 S-adenosyl-L-methionine-dependent methyltransferase [Dichomitus squalens]TBU65757.1 S-adenosyl-L-methionine-dependent methyltransferase [Dichomitus squalens]
MPDVQPTTVSVENPQSYEDTHVHAVYDEIAPHFASTRYKPWPIIAAFLASLPTGWIGVDLGTGNGKYLPLPADRPGSVWTIGYDRSINLLKIAKRAGDVDREVVLGDVLDNPWRKGAFDYAISIATIHHLATPARRKLAVQRLLQTISPSHGRGLIYVWAIEQDDLSKRSIPTCPNPKDSRFDIFTLINKGQDVFVPWVLAQQADPKPKGRKGKKTHAISSEESEPAPTAPSSPPKVFERYYHMFAHGELTDLVTEAALETGLVIGQPPEAIVPGRKIQGVQIVQDGWERSNYYVEVHRWEL